MIGRGGGRGGPGCKTAERISFDDTNTCIVASNLQEAIEQTLLARKYHTAVTGVIDGVNTVFTLAEEFKDGSETIFVNGVEQESGIGCDYVTSESGGAGTGFDTITFTYAPIASDRIDADYTTCIV